MPLIIRNYKEDISCKWIMIRYISKLEDIIAITVSTDQVSYIFYPNNIYSWLFTLLFTYIYHSNIYVDVIFKLSNYYNWFVLVCLASVNSQATIPAIRVPNNVDKQKCQILLFLI